MMMEPSATMVMDSNVVKKTTTKSILFFDEETTAKFMCSYCKKTFYNAVALQNHMKIQHDGAEEKRIEPQTTRSISSENFKDLCGFKFVPLHDDNSDSSPHTSNGVNSRVFAEDTTFLLVKVEGRDMETAKKGNHNGTKRGQPKPMKPPVDLRGPFTCTFRSALRPDLQCRQIFFNCCDYSLHYREEHTRRRNAALRCQVCEKRLDNDSISLYSLNTLASQLQASRYTFSCQPCGLTFLERADFDEHNRIEHAKMKPHQCPICTKRFTQQGGLQQHMRMHTGIRPFVCTFCPKAFTQKAGLDQHLRTHTKIKPFKCVICSKCFSQSVHLRQHMRTHTNIQPFECSVCGKRFKQSSHLNFHTRSHVVGASSLDIEKYAQAMPYRNQMEFLNLSNLQPVQDGETLYYAAELAMGPPAAAPVFQDQFSYKTQVPLSNHPLQSLSSIN